MKKSYVLPDSLNRRLISSLMSSKPISADTKGVPSKDFSPKSSTDFASRSGDIFGKLNNLESDHENWISKNETLVFENPLTDQIECTNKDPHVFRKPLPFVEKKRKKNPVKRMQNSKRSSQKWVKYSLEDVELSSDATNKAVGLKFFAEMKKAHEQQNQETAYDGQEKLVFSKPKLSVGECSKNTVSSSSDRPVMKNKLNKEKSQSVSSSIKLTHLEYEDDE